MKKKVYIFIFSVIICLIFIYWVQQWSGKSEDGKWKVVYKKDLSLLLYGDKFKNHTYHGLLYYIGKNEDNIEILFCEFRRNGRYSCGCKVNYEITFPYEFCVFGGKSQKGDNLVLILE